MSFHDTLRQLYSETTGCEPTAFRPITGSASSRRYCHIDGTRQLVGVTNDNVTENRAFIHIGTTLKSHGINVPQLVAVNADETCYLQQDLGDTSLLDVIKNHGFDDYTFSLCRKAIDQLVRLQIIGNENIDTKRCYPVPAMTEDSVRWDLDYFKYCFLKVSGISVDEPRLESEFKAIVQAITSARPRLFIHRDFQSRNILIFNDDAWIIDFQGGRIGPALYDIVSFLWQARAGFPDTVKNELLGYYTDRLTALTGNADNLKTGQLWHIVAFRMLQVLGAYGFRGIIEHKPQFLSHIPDALDLLGDALSHLGCKYPYLIETVRVLRAGYTDRAPLTTPCSLTVRVTSFSYKNGIPSDPTGNGGGFVFDCRAIHNPGRYDQYRNLTGNDVPVIEFLERDGEILTFLDHCLALVDASVQRYIDRGFSSLTISYGCTGGRHRSVYAATHTAMHIAQHYGVHVILEHREQGLTQEYNRYPSDTKL